MGSQFSEEFLLGYRAGHRDGFADAVVLVRDAVTPYEASRAMARREAEIARLLTGEVREQESWQTIEARI